jgi:hypothetical protein
MQKNFMLGHAFTFPNPHRWKMLRDMLKIVLIYFAWNAYSSGEQLISQLSSIKG